MTDERREILQQIVDVRKDMLDRSLRANHGCAIPVVPLDTIDQQRIGLLRAKLDLSFLQEPT